MEFCFFLSYLFCFCIPDKAQWRASFKCFIAHSCSIWKTLGGTRHGNSFIWFVPECDWRVLLTSLLKAKSINKDSQNKKKRLFRSLLICSFSGNRRLNRRTFSDWLLGCSISSTIELQNRRIERGGWMFLLWGKQGKEEEKGSGMWIERVCGTDGGGEGWKTEGGDETEVQLHFSPGCRSPSRARLLLRQQRH